MEVLSDARMGSNNLLLKEIPVSEIIWKYLWSSFQSRDATLIFWS